MKSTLLTGCCLLLLTSASARADVLFAIDTELQLVSGSRTLNPRTQFTPHFQYRTNLPDTLLTTIFENLIVRMSDVGTTFVATPENDPGFAAFAHWLTDGQEKHVTFPTGPGVALGAPECGKLYQDHTCLSGVDFHGNVINRITFTQKEWVTETPGRDLGGDGIWTDVYGALRITIEGHAIPEPSTALMIAAAIPVFPSMRLRASSRQRTLTS